MIFLAGFLSGIALTLLLSALARYSYVRDFIDQDGATGGSSITGTDAPSLEIEISIEEWVNKGWVNRQGGW